MISRHPHLGQNHSYVKILFEQCLENITQSDRRVAIDTVIHGFLGMQDTCPRFPYSEISARLIALLARPVVRALMLLLIDVVLNPNFIGTPFYYSSRSLSKPSQS